MRTDHCSHCSMELPASHIGPCPNCGKEGKTTSLSLHDIVVISDSLSWELTKTYYERHPVLIVLIVGAPFLGLFMVGWFGVVVGLVVSVVSFFLGAQAVIKVINREKGKST